MDGVDDDDSLAIRIEIPDLWEWDWGPFTRRVKLHRVK